jgi:hypothetical protein
LKPFYKQFAIFCGVIFWILLSIQLFKPELVQVYSWVLLFYFIGITWLSYYLVDNSLKTNDALDFYNASMGSTTIRLFISGGILFYYFFNYQKNQVHFAATFFALYFPFTAFEVLLLLQKMRKK